MLYWADRRTKSSERKAEKRDLGFKKDEVDGIIEVIFNDVKKLTAKDLSNEELFEEVKRRLDE